MTILAIDPATRCGFALAHAGSIIAAGTWDLSTRRDESAGMRLIRLRGKLTEIVPGNSVAVVVYERPNHTPGRPDATISHAELAGVIKTYCIDAGIEYRGYSPSEIKRHATGKGNANKDAMVAAARRKWPGFAGDDNEADARWLADLAMRDVGHV